jgi:chromosomal replication initiation ATPase DnaA
MSQLQVISRRKRIANTKAAKKNCKVIANDIIQKVCDYYCVDINNVCSKKRDRRHAIPCQVSCYLIKSKIGKVLSYNEIALLFKDRYIGSNGLPDHAAIIYNKNLVSNFIDANDSIVQDIEKLNCII